jgi:hypothetical protein
MTAHDLVPRASQDESALDSLLNRAVPWESLGKVLPRDLVRLGLYGSAVMILTALLALAIPSTHSIRHGGLFLLFASIAAGLAAFLHAVAVPAIVFGLLLLGVDLYLSNVPTGGRSRLVVIGQAAIGGVGGGIGVLFLALVVFNVVLWLVIIACIAGACLAMLGALAAGG